MQRMADSRRIVVTTSWSVLLIDVETSSIHPIHRGKGLYYGLSYDRRGHLWVACRNRSVSSEAPPADECGDLIVLDHRLRHRWTVAAPFPLRDLHAIEWIGDQLWITCSRDNMIAITDGSTWSKWYPQPEDHDDRPDIHHYNTVSKIGDLLYLVAHNHGPSDLLAFDEDRALLQSTRMGRCAHDVWLEDGVFYTFSSAEGLILGTDGSSRRLGSFPRGYARLHDGTRVVGITEHAVRSERDNTSSTLQFFDEDWRKTNEIVLEGEGMTLAILPLGERRGPLLRLLDRVGGRR